MCNTSFITIKFRWFQWHFSFLFPVSVARVLFPTIEEKPPFEKKPGFHIFTWMIFFLSFLSERNYFLSLTRDLYHWLVQVYFPGCITITPRLFQQPPPPFVFIYFSFISFHLTCLFHIFLSLFLFVIYSKLFWGILISWDQPNPKFGTLRTEIKTNNCPFVFFSFSQIYKHVPSTAAAASSSLCLFF